MKPRHVPPRNTPLSLGPAASKSGFSDGFTTRSPLPVGHCSCWRRRCPSLTFIVLWFPKVSSSVACLRVPVLRRQPHQARAPGPAGIKDQLLSSWVPGAFLTLSSALTKVSRRKKHSVLKRETRNCLESQAPRNQGLKHRSCCFNSGSCCCITSVSHTFDSSLVINQSLEARSCHSCSLQAPSSPPGLDPPEPLPDEPPGFAAQVSLEPRLGIRLPPQHQRKKGQREYL